MRDGHSINSQQAIKDHMQQKVLVVDESDRQIWSLVTNVPLVSIYVAVIAAIFNFLLPGFGTAIAACAASHNVSKT